MKDHIDMLLMIPPKFSVANTIGFLKGSQQFEFSGIICK
jgi:REP element-mobilizing transposase RayT